MLVLLKLVEVNSVYSTTVINISDNAKIVNTLYLGKDYPDYEGTTKYLEYLDIILEGGNINISNFSGEIGVIAKIGSGKINANALSNTNKIGIFVGDQQYYRNNTIVNSNSDNSSYFELLYGKVEYDKLMKSSSSNNTVLSMVLAIEISISDIWELNPDGKYYKIDSSGINVSDENFDTVDELKDYAESAGLSDYEPSYRASTQAIIFYIDTNKGLNLESLSDLAVRSGYSMNGFVIHSENASVNASVDASDFYGMTGRIATQDFSDNEDHIYLGVVYQPNSYTINFSNGGLLTATQNMDNQVIQYTDFETGNPQINSLGYYATGFVFTGWKVQVAGNSYVQYGGHDLVLSNGADLKTYINLISTAVGSNTFVFEAQWAQIFTGDPYVKDSNAGIGTSSSNAFVIKDKAGLNVLADTVNSIQNTYTVNINGNLYNYYNGVDEDNTLTFTKTSYLGYYFEFTNNIGSESDPVTSIIGRLDYQGDNLFTTGNSNNRPIQGPEILEDVEVFSGSLNGNNYTVYLGIDPATDTDQGAKNYDFVGLFGYAKDATISNIVLQGSVKGRISVGGLVGLAYGGNYSNIRNKANISFNGINAGGIFGTYYLQSGSYRSGSITNVVNEGNVTYTPNTSDPIGTAVEVTESWTEDSLLVAYQGTRAGGIIGQGWHITLLEAYNSGAITARFGVGGLVGTMISENDDTKNDNTITTGFNSGSVEATSGLATNYQYNSNATIIEINAYVGGIVGRLVGASTVSNAMNTGTVQASWQGIATKDIIDSNTKSTDFQYKSNVSEAKIGARGAGGIIGETSIELESLKGGNKDIRNVINAGSVSAWSHVGGIAGIFAYSDLSYALNIGSITSKGKITYLGNSYAFNGALVGLGIAANLLSTAVFSYDTGYAGYNDLTIQAIGNENGSYTLYGIANVNSAKKLASAHLICQPGDNKPIGLDSTFFSSGWDWKSYDIIASSSDTGSSSDAEKESQYYYFPQLVSFVNNTTTLGSTTVGDLSKQAVTLKGSSDNGSEDEITDTTNINITLDVQGGSISSETEIKIDNITFTIINGKLVATINYNSYIDKQIDLSNLAQYITKESYYLDSWCIDSTLSEEFTGVISNNDFTIYAKWEPTEYNIALTGLQQYSNANVELDGESFYTYTIEDFSSKRTLDLPTIKSNRAYQFEYWIFTYAGQTYKVTQLYFYVNGTTNTIRLTLYNQDSTEIKYEYISLSSLTHLDFTLYCSPINYDISYSYAVENNEGDQPINTPVNNGSISYNINSTFDIAIPSSDGYTFDHWEYNGEEVTSIQDVIKALGANALANISLVGIFTINKYYLSINLNGGNFTNGFTYGDYTFTLNSQGLYQTQIDYNASIGWLWAKDNFEAYISAPAGKTFSKLTFGVDGSENKITNMPYADLIVYAQYETTSYNILLDAGMCGSTSISFDSDINYEDIDSRLELDENNNLCISAAYGSDLEEILLKLRDLLINSSVIPTDYHFNSFTTTNDNGTKFNYFNIQNIGTNPKITFNWSKSEYSITIFDSLGNYIKDYNTGSSRPAWVEEGSNNINIDKLIETINTLDFAGLDGYVIPNGYVYQNKYFTISINNAEVYSYDGTNPSIEQINITGYTIIKLQLDEKTYNVSLTDEGTSLGTGTISYNQKIDYNNFATPTKNGYNFVGWYYNGSLLIEGNNFIPSNTDISGENVTFVAQWEKARYTITFEFKSSYYWQGTIPNKTIMVLYNDGETISLDADYFNEEGYNFVSATYKEESKYEINDSFLESLETERYIIMQVNLSIKTFNVEFNAGDGAFPDGSKSQTKIVKYYETAADYLPDDEPEKDGSEFSEYVSNIDKIYLQTPITRAGISFTAQYVANIYSITLITDESTEVISDLMYGTNFDLSSYRPTKQGYTFIGWDDLGTPTTEAYIDNISSVNKNYVLKATFVINTNNLTFNVSDSNNSAIKEKLLGQLKALQITIVATWPDSGIFAVQYNTDLSSLNNLVLQSNNINYQIVYKVDNANYIFGQMPDSSINVNVESVQLEENEPIYQTITGTISYKDNQEYRKVTFTAIKQGNYYKIINNVTYSFEGHNFDNKWTYNGSEYTDLREINFTESEGFNISATISKKTFTITIITYDNNTITLIVDYGTSLSSLTKDSDVLEISRPGYSFNNVFLYNGENANNIEVTQDMTISMNWVPASYKIIFEYTNSDDTTKTLEYTYNYDAIINLPKIEDLMTSITREYYNPSYATKVISGKPQKDFEDIFVDGKMVDLSATGEVWSDYVVDNNNTYSITFVLVPEPKQYTINFVGNNIDNVVNVNPLVFNIEDTISFTAPQIAHYNYIGISKVRDGEVVSSLSFDYLISLFDSNDLRTQSINAYLKYETIPYTANFVVIEQNGDGDDQKIDIASIGFNVETENGYIIIPNDTPTKEGYTFVGWKLGEITYTYNIPVDKLLESLNGNSVELVADFIPREYIVSFYDFKTNIYTSDLFDYGTTYGQLYAKLVEWGYDYLYLDGYEFNGWKDGSGNLVVSNNIEDVVLNSIVFIANWIAHTYTVEFNGNDATHYGKNEIGEDFELPTQTFTYDEAQKLSSNDFGRTGYRFLGWSTNPSATEATYIDGQSVINLPYDENGIVVLYAVWEIITYNINYDLVVSGNPSTYNVETTTITLKEPNAESGYKFLGWYSGQTKVETIEKGSTGDISLVAKWEVITYTITYDVKDGNNSVANKDSYSILANITFANPTREGYTFVNWTYNGQEITSTDGRFENLVLVANWEIITYNINYDLVVSGNPSTYNVETATITLNKPEKLGYKFLGWYNGQTKVETIEKGSTGNLNLVAQWEALEYTISFDVNNTKYLDEVTDVKINYNQLITEIPTLTLDGYRFIGWYDKDGKHIANGMIYDYTNDIELIASWEKAIYSITLTIDNVPTSLSNTIIGEISTNLKDYSYSVKYVENTNSIIVIIDVPYETNISFVDDLISDEEYTAGDIDYIFAGFDVSFDNTNMPSTDISAKGKFVTSEIRVLLYIDGIIAKTITPNLLTNGTYTLSKSDLDTFIKTGYTLSKWYSDYNYNTEYNFGDTENTSKSLYAKWLPINYYVKFNANGGSGSMSNQTLTYDESNELTPNGFKYTGYTFIGWATTSNGDVVYTDHQMVINLSTKQDDVVNLYAIWSPNTYQIVFNGNGGTGNMPNQDIKYNETLELNAQQFSKIGYSFIGWAKTPNGPIDYYDCDEFTQNITNSVTLYALWKENEYTISFAVNNDEYEQTVSSIQIEYDKYISDIPTLTLAGYRFIGWYDADGRQVINGMIYDYTSNITLTARWDNDTYNVTFDMAGGNQIPSQNVSYGGHIDVSNINPERLGYTFSHFTANGIEYYLSGEGKLLLADYEMTSSNITFTAVWNANTYNISYELDGGSITLGTNPTTFEYGKISLNALLNGLKKPEKEGYTFTNWSVDVTSLPASDLIITAEYSINRYLVEFDTAGGNYINPIYVEYKDLIPTQIVSKTGYDFSYFTYEGKKVDLSTFLMPANNIILVAAYDRLEYQVTFNYMYNDLMGTLGYNVEENKVLETPSRNGYSFGGWYLNEEYTGEAIISTAGYAENLELYAKWNKNTYQITYVLNDDIENNNPNSYDVENIVEFANPMRAGYVFDGWYLDADYKNQITDTTGRIGNLVLHAKWVLEDEYTITYENVDNYDGITNYTVESNVVFKTPTKTGHKFVGWDYEGTYITSTNGLVGDITVTAVWEIITYNINYDLDEGTLTSANPSTYNVETATITLNEPEKLGYKFLGWYNGQTKVETIEQGSTGDISLVAKWQVITYTITYDLNDGTNNVANKDSYSVVANITFASPTREGYTFVNWTYNGQEITSTDERFENLVLVANWEVTNYSIVYNLDGGTNSSENPTSYNVEKVVGFKEPTKTGYTFVAWYLDSDYTIEIGDTTGYAKDLVLYAKWEINSYKVSFLTGELGINVPEITMNYYETYGSKLPVLEMPYGISFVTWYYETTDGEVVNVTKDSIFNLITDITLKAQYTTTAFNIVYETNGGINHSSNVTTVTALAMAEKPLVLLAPSKTGYSFVGWYLDSSFGGEAVVEISPAILANSTNGILTLYAKYEVSRYTITYQDIDGTVIKTVNNVAYNSLAELFTPTKDGYIFDAWYLNGAKYDFNTPVTGNLTLVAMYRIMEVSTETIMNNETVKVVVTSVDGKGLPADAHIVIELVVEEESNNQVADLLQEYGQVSRFYDIKLVDAKGNEIAPSSEVRVTLSLPNEEITVDKTYSIVNIKDDLSDWQEIESYLKDGNLEFFTTHFSYYAIVVTDKAIDFTWLWIVLGVAGFLLVQVIIIVIIKTRRFKIRFVSKGNVKVKEIKYRKNMSVTLPTPSRIGYKFVGWYLDQEFKYPANIKTMPNENLILYARWIEDPLTIGLKVKKTK